MSVRLGLLAAALAACADPSARGRPPAPPPDRPVPPGLPSCPTARAPADLPDDGALHQVRALYVLPSDAADRQLDTSGRICHSVLNFTRWLSSQSGGRHLRLDTRGGILDIGFVRLARTDAEMRGTGNTADLDTGYAFLRDRIERELRSTGLIRRGKLYAVYYGGSSPWSCGGGAWPPALIGQVSAMYLEGTPPGAPPCNTNLLGPVGGPPGYLDYAMLHELMHGLGFVADGAAHEHAAGHSWDATPDKARDLMYAPRAGSGDPGWDSFHPGGLLLDIGRDDYLDHGRSGVLDLARSAFLEPLPADAGLPPGW